MSNESQHVIIDILKRRGLLSGTSARAVLGFMTKWSISAFHAVLETHVLDETRLADILSEEFRLIRLSRLRSQTVQKDALQYMPYRQAMACEMMPLKIHSDGSLHVVVADPSRTDDIVELRKECSLQVVLFVAERGEIESAIQRNYPLAMQLPLTMTACLNLHTES